jgi:hypothetical protein
MISALDEQPDCCHSHEPIVVTGIGMITSVGRDRERRGLPCAAGEAGFAV